MKYRFLILIVVITLSIIFVSADSDNVIYGEPLAFDMFEGETVYQTELKEETDIGYQFHAATDFNGFGIYISNAVIARDPSVTVSLYKWDRDYAQTVGASPVYSELIEISTRTGWITSAFDKLPSGEYVLELKAAVGNVKVDIVSPGLENTAVYQDKTERTGSLKCRINYINTPEIKLKNISDNIRGYNMSANTWVYTDGLGRSNPDHSETGSIRENKYVGIFYHTWHIDHSQYNNRNITEVLKEFPKAKNDFRHKVWPASHTNYFWNEPLFGYYNNGIDKWVLRKHAELLGDAGVDVLFFDQTNGTNTYIEGILTLLEVFAEARADGVKTPAISAMLPMFDYTAAAVQLEEMYDKIYSKGLYKDLWFYWEGKPLMLAWPGGLKLSDPKHQKIYDFFTYRPINPSYTREDAQALDTEGNITIKWSPPYGVREDYICWKWISIYPQAVAYRKDGSPEQMCVCIAQNWSKEQGITAMNAGDHVFGRSYSDKKGYDLSEKGKLYGANFAEQWEYALKVDPDFIYITGWNEWVAGRFQEMWGTENAFPDNFSDNYSRDIEPSMGDLKDHYYYQMVSYIRRFKGTDDFQRSNGLKSIDIYSDTDQWNDVEPFFYAYGGNTLTRNYDGYKGHHYDNDTGRNDITGAKVSYDKEYIYCMVETKDKLSDPTGNAWMRLFIDVDESDKNWETFEYVINRRSPGDKAVVERSKGGWDWEAVGEAEYSVKDNRLQIKVKKKTLGIKGDRFELNFKWSDNMQNEGDIFDFYQYGDTAPIGRFKYRFVSYKQGKYLDFKYSKWQKFSMILSGIAILGVTSAIVIRKIRKAKNK